MEEKITKQQYIGLSANEVQLLSLAFLFLLQNVICVLKQNTNHLTFFVLSLQMLNLILN